MVENWIVDWFLTNSSIAVEELDKDANYIDSGYIDSFGFIALISDCEEHFEISFKDSDFESFVLMTVNGLVRTIEGYIV